MVYVPLQFWFCRNPGLALPLIALQYHEVKVILNLDLRRFSCSCCRWCQILNYLLITSTLILMKDVDLLKFLTNTLIEQVQEQSYTRVEKNMTLNFNHPVKALYLFSRNTLPSGCWCDAGGTYRW